MVVVVLVARRRKRVFCEAEKRPDFWPAWRERAGGLQSCISRRAYGGGGGGAGQE